MAHRDIKPANIFQDEHYYKLGDFGSACQFGVGRTTGDGTHLYLSPEMRRCLLGEQVEVDPYQSDVFSLGITMLQLAQGKPESIATAWRTVEDLQRAVEEEIRDLPCSEAFVDLIRHMLKMNPQERLQFHQIRQKILPEASNSPTPPSTMEDFYSQLSLAAKLLSSGDYTGTESVLLRLMPTVNKSPLKEKQLPWLLKAFSSLYMLQGRST